MTRVPRAIYTEAEALQILKGSAEHIAGLDTVPVSEMFVDHGYGRPLTESLVKKITASFVEAGLGVVYLSLRDSGMYAILDGQHRWVAAKRKGIARMHARIYIDLSYEQEAALYTIFGDHRAQSRSDIFRAKLEAKDPDAIDIARIIERAGLHFFGALYHNGSVQAIGACENIYKRYGGETLDLTVRTIYAAFGPAAKAYQAPMLDGVTQFILRYEEQADWVRVVSRLKDTGVPVLIQKMRQLQEALSNGERGPIMGRVILGVYNMRLTEDKQLEPWVDYKGTFKAPRRTVNLPSDVRLRQRNAFKDVPNMEPKH